MPIPTGVWGIDLGQCALKALRVEVIDGQVTATAFDYVEHPKILSQPDADPDQLTREALEKFLSRNTLKGDLVAISIPGQSGLARFVKLPPVEEKKITDIVRFEAKQQIPFNLEEVVWDYQKIGTGVVTDGFAMETEIGLFAIKRDTVNRYLQHFKDVNVEVHIVQMAPLSLCNFVSYDLLQADGEGAEKEKGAIVALDIGADNSNLVITDGGRIIWQRPIPLGGNHFTRALTKDLKLTFAKAEHLKRNATKSPDLKKILAALKPVLNDFVGEVQRSLGYFTNTHRDANIQYMIGLGNAFRLPGLQKFLAEKLQLDVRKLQKLERLQGDSVVSAPVYTENVLSFAVAYGLALQGLALPRLQTNLLPQEIRMERLVRAKKPWAAAAAAALLFGTGIYLTGNAMQYRAVAAQSVKDAMKNGDDVKKVAGEWQSKCDAELKRIEDAKKAVKSIIAGQDERINWIQLTRFINEAVPQPNGSNLSATPKAKYYTNSEKAQAAARAFYLKQSGKFKPGEAKPDEEEGLSDLIHVNVEAIACRYSDDLSGFIDKLKAARTGALETMRDKDAKTKPEGKGWVVEVRGYTYHVNQRRFIIETFLDNLARMRVKDDGTTAAAGTAPAAPGSPPAPAVPPAAAAPGTAAVAGTEPAKTGEGDKAAAEDPVLNKVSHVVLYASTRVDNPEPTFTLINESVAGEMASPGTGAPGGPMGMSGAGMPGPGSPGSGGSAVGGPGDAMGARGSTRDSWAPLGTGGGTAGGRGGMMPGMPGMPGGSGMPGMPGMPGRGSGGGSGMGLPGMPGGAGSRGGRAGGSGMGLPGMPGAPGSRGGLPGMEDPNQSGEETTGKAKKGQLTRTEFIILFLWKEPTPSDSLLSTPDAPASGAAPGVAR